MQLSILRFGEAIQQVRPTSWLLLGMWCLALMVIMTFTPLMTPMTCWTVIASLIGGGISIPLLTDVLERVFAH